jgi:hypothetical protein
VKFLRTLFACFAMIAAGTASADRVFDLEIEVKVSSSAGRVSGTVTGLLTLFDDQSYLLAWDGEESVGIWIQEKNNLQMFEDGDSTFAEYIDWLEQDASILAGFPVALASLNTKETARFDRSGNLKMRSKQITLFRPGLRGTSPLKIIWSSKTQGTLR